MKRILLVKTSSLGDVIHNLPVVNDLLQHYPDAQIDWVVEGSFADIPKLHPHVNQVFTVAMRRWRKQLFSQQTWAEIAQFKQAIAAQHYDVVIDTQGLFKSAVIACLAKGERHGYDKYSIREPLASLLYRHTHAISYQQHAVVRNRMLVAMSLGYAIPTDAPDYGLSAQTFSIDLPLPKNYVMGLHGTSKDSKLWPEQHWIALAQSLAPLPLLLPWANEAEYARAQRIAKAATNIQVLPKLSIAQLAGMIAHAQAAIGVDTGLSHLSAALDVPTVALYTDTNPTLTGVMAGAKMPAVNLGGVAQTPAPKAVLDCLAEWITME